MSYYPARGAPDRRGPQSHRPREYQRGPDPYYPPGSPRRNGGDYRPRSPPPPMNDRYPPRNRSLSPGEYRGTSQSYDRDRDRFPEPSSSYRGRERPEGGRSWDREYDDPRRRYDDYDYQYGRDRDHGPPPPPRDWVPREGDRSRDRYYDGPREYPRYDDRYDDRRGYRPSYDSRPLSPPPAQFSRRGSPPPLRRSGPPSPRKPSDGGVGRDFTPYRRGSSTMARSPSRHSSSRSSPRRRSRSRSRSPPTHSHILPPTSPFQPRSPNQPTQPHWRASGAVAPGPAIDNRDGRERAISASGPTLFTSPPLHTPTGPAYPTMDIDMPQQSTHSSVPPPSASLYPDSAPRAPPTQPASTWVKRGPPLRPAAEASSFRGMTTPTPPPQASNSTTSPSANVAPNTSNIPTAPRTLQEPKRPVPSSGLRNNQWTSGQSHPHSHPQPQSQHQQQPSSSTSTSLSSATALHTPTGPRAFSGIPTGPAHRERDPPMGIRKVEEVAPATVAPQAVPQPFSIYTIPAKTPRPVSEDEKKIEELKEKIRAIDAKILVSQSNNAKARHDLTLSLLDWEHASFRARVAERQRVHLEKGMASMEAFDVLESEGALGRSVVGRRGIISMVHGGRSQNQF